MRRNALTTRDNFNKATEVVSRFINLDSRNALTTRDNFNKIGIYLYKIDDIESQCPHNSGQFQHHIADSKEENGYKSRNALTTRDNFNW